ncbi:protein-L-isoaspartate(D-aspartate) O-methyltransferase [Paenalcaligenes niemegkensis]|uniref:protein-L-isoaspartate(D-aspartate) O-methyltransferase n=1 Tax=Paenalcaligenes niemegkensis TaxID=2895469 RepID=UPI001EE92159|nr:protein-L-isoaspartate(D-aspartate) O-methyltransferase [Paenalcaligenes niemegkensis]MCQ9616243.1 protein-L-isoaspartate(D-aspartate) O-methyltransferase [Paenalcaligenes niemegkensis]
MKRTNNRFSWTDGTTNRFGRSRLGSGLTTSNSNARVVQPGKLKPEQASAAETTLRSVNLGLNSERSRGMMIERLRRQGIDDERVLQAMMAVPRHVFIDEGLASRAYEDDALPIGHGQTISQPWVVARMISMLCQRQVPAKVLEVGAGCGYQAAVLAQLASEVYAIERIQGLYDLASKKMRELRLSSRVRLSHADGMEGLPHIAPFEAIIVAAAGITIPKALLEQLVVGGRLIAPEGSTTQRLILIERTGTASWHREELDAVRFVPLRPGTQI